MGTSLNNPQWLAFPDGAKRSWRDLDGLLRQPPEEFAPMGTGTPVEAKGELIHIGVEVVVFHRRLRHCAHSHNWRAVRAACVCPQAGHTKPWGQRKDSR